MDLFKGLGITVGEPSLIEVAPDNLAMSNRIKKGHLQQERQGVENSSRERLWKGIGADENDLVKHDLKAPSIPQHAKGDANGDGYGSASLKDNHGESHHSDASKELIEDKVDEVDRVTAADEEEAPATRVRLAVSASGGVWRSVESALDDLCKGFDNMPLKPGGKAKKPAKDPVEVKQELQQKKELGVSKAKKKDDDSIIKVTKEKTSPKLIANVHENSPGVAERRRPAVMKALDETASAAKKYTPAPVQARPAPVQAKRNSFIKAEGPGGIVFDFGPLTGNKFADFGTELLRGGDPVQESIATEQQNAYDKALTNFVTKGRADAVAPVPFGNVDTGWKDQLDKSMDQQVVEAYKSGALEEKTAVAPSQYNKTEITLGGEVIKATSETDAALIELMLKSQAAPEAGGMIADAMGGGKVGICADAI